MFASGPPEPNGITTLMQASPTSPPVLFWSPSCTITWRRYAWPGIRPSCETPQTTSLVYFCVEPPGFGSAPVPSAQFGFAAGSEPTLMLFPDPVTAFQLPKIFVG